MRHVLGVCRHGKPAPAKAKPLLGDMATSVPHFFFFFFFDMIIKLANATITHRKGGMT